MDINDTPLPPTAIFVRSSNYTSSVDGNKSNIIFELNTPILSYPNTELLISLDSFKFTNSFYTINENNCCFYYSLDTSPTAKVTVSLSFGNYDIDSLVEYLNILLVDKFTFTYSLSTLKITIVGSLPFKLMSGLNNVYELLGFDDNQDSLYLLSTLTSPYLFNMMGVQVLHIVCPNLNIKSIGLKNTPKYNILASVQVLVTSGQTQTYLNSNLFRYKLNDSAITFINLVIYDQDFNMVNFNNIDWFCNINVSFNYIKPLIQAKYIEDTDSTSAQFILLQEERRKLVNEINNIKT